MEGYVWLYSIFAVVSLILSIYTAKQKDYMASIISFMCLVISVVVLIKIHMIGI